MAARDPRPCNRPLTGDDVGGRYWVRTSDLFRVRAALPAHSNLSPPVRSAWDSAGDHTASPRLAGSLAVRVVPARLKCSFRWLCCRSIATGAAGSPRSSTSRNPGPGRVRADVRCCPAGGVARLPGPLARPTAVRRASVTSAASVGSAAAGERVFAVEPATLGGHVDLLLGVDAQPAGPAGSRPQARRGTGAGVRLVLGAARARHVGGLLPDLGPWAASELAGLQSGARRHRGLGRRHLHHQPGSRHQLRLPVTQAGGWLPTRPAGRVAVVPAGGPDPAGRRLGADHVAVGSPVASSIVRPRGRSDGEASETAIVKRPLTRIELA